MNEDDSADPAGTDPAQLRHYMWTVPGAVECGWTTVVACRPEA
jgi:hypothetical protein